MCRPAVLSSLFSRLTLIAILIAAVGLTGAKQACADDTATDPAVATSDAPEGEEKPTTDEAEAAPAEEAEESALLSDVNVLWTCLAAFLVFFMQAGFAMVEAGFTRAKNACNIIMKNLLDFSVGSLSFWLVGFGLMFGTTQWGLFGTDGFVFDGGEDKFAWAFLLFQTVFCATAATIVSGAVAERTKYSSYIIYTIFITVVVYPIFGKWAWGGLNGDSAAGWLEAKGFLDFAGSTVVHSIGGWAALAGALVLGPRIGKYDGKKITPIPGHNIPLAALGVFVLWLGWFGFNPGSTTAVEGGAIGSMAYIAVTTNLAAAAGVVGAMITSWIAFKKPDVSFALNGALAGLVAITAGCDCLSPFFSALTGLIAGVLVVGSCYFFDKIRIDDPVGAISVHGVCGAFGTIAVGLFHMESGLVLGGGTTQLMAQFLGVAVGFGWAFGVSLVVFLGIKYTVGLRVSEQEEIEGLDITEHGMYAYPPSLVTGVTSATPPLAAQSSISTTPATEKA